MSEEVLALGNMLAAILNPIYYCLFMIYTKKISDKKLYFISLSIVDYLMVQNIVKFTAGVDADLVYLILFYINLKLLYKDKARITDVITYIISDVVLGIISVISYFTLGMNFMSLIFVTVMPILLVMIMSSKMNILERFYNKYWNRKKAKVKIKSITVRGISVCLTVFEFLALHFWMIYLLLK